MKKLQVLTEAMEKAKEKYWEEDTAICLAVELWKYSSGNEIVQIGLWVDAKKIFSSPSFDELLVFLNDEPSGNPAFTTFGGAPPASGEAVHA